MSVVSMSDNELDRLKVLSAVRSGRLLATPWSTSARSAGLVFLRLTIVRNLQLRQMPQRGEILNLGPGDIKKCQF